jgi:hypothetical protein
MGHVPKELIKLTNTLLDIPDLRFPLNDQRVLEVNFVL